MGQVVCCVPYRCVHAHAGGMRALEVVVAKNKKELEITLGAREAAPGIVIHDRWEQPRPPAISAFIWGGKVRPVPALPYGRTAA